MEQKHDDDKRDDDRFFDERPPQRPDRFADQARAVVSGHELHTGRHRRLDVAQLGFHAVDHAQRILAEPHHDDAAHHLAFAVELRDAAPDVGTEAHLRDVAHVNRRAAAVGAERHGLDVIERFQVAAPADHVLAPGELEQAAFDVVVAGLDRRHDVADADVVSRQLVRIDVHLVLLDEAADARDLRDTGHRCQPIAEIPILKTSEIRQTVLPRFVDQRVFEHPAHAGRIGTNDWIRAFR